MQTELATLPVARASLPTRPSLPEVRAIVRTALRAPSGDNTQPWKIAIDGDTLHLDLDDARSSQVGFGGFGGLLSLGALAESVRMEAAQRGYGTTLVWDESRDAASVRVVFGDEAPSVGRLPLQLRRRRTTRGAYASAPIFSAELGALEQESSGIARVAVRRRASEIAAVADASALAERVRFDDTDPRDLYPWLRFSPAEVARTRDGLDTRLMALRSHETLALRLSGSAFLTWCMRRLGGGWIAARRLRSEVLASGGVGAIVIPDTTPGAFIEAGRVMLRTWLRATALGLAFAPVTVGAVLPLSRSFGRTFTRASHRRLDRAAGALRDVFAMGSSGVTPFVFRVGVSAEPTLESERRPLSSFVTSER